RHLNPALLGKRRDCRCAQRLDQPRYADTTHRPIQSPSFDQRLLFADEVDLVPEQAPHFMESVGDKMSGKSVPVVPVSKVLGQSLEIVHVFGEVLGDMRLQHFENSALTPPGFRISPTEAHDRADARFREYGRCYLDGVGLDLLP